MTESPATESDQLFVTMGKLTLAAAYLETAIIAMVCRIMGKSEEEISEEKIGWGSNEWWCKKLNEVAPAEWDKQLLAKCTSNIRALYKQRNGMIHAALGVAGDDSILGVPRSSLINLRTYGLQFRPDGPNRWSIGVGAERVQLSDVDKLSEDIHAARLSLAPFMDLADKIKHPPKPFPVPPS
jgi:hypothetical protein